MAGNTNSGRKGKIEKAEASIKPQPREKIPVPQQLKGHSLEYWKRVVNYLVERGEYNPVDEPALQRLALFYGEWKKMEEFVLQKGMTYDATTDRGAYVRRENPEAKLMININKEMKDLERKFGLTPVDRKGNHNGGQPTQSVRDKY